MMQLQFIRNATMRLTYAGYLILTDPFLSPKHALQPFGGVSRNPLVELPMSPEDVIAGAEMVLVSHLHSDHFDSVAQALLPKDVPIFCQAGDESRIAELGFVQVTPIADRVEWQGISIIRTTGQHGTGEWIEKMGTVSGFVLRAAGEPTIYWMGDTIWYDEVAQIMADAQPDIIITHSSGARFGDSDPIVMDIEQTIAVCDAVLSAIVVAIHLESLDHGTVTRHDLRANADAHGISPQRLRIPADGETLEFNV